ncbi:hypothetical protein [Archangium sp.]|uniref:hypothetical protein n=1 Tax=Archangium sp. TaxID=1872627 RepID=UPI0039C8B27C
MLWVVDGAELASPAVTPTRLAERAAWRSTGACPFDIALRTEGPSMVLTLSCVEGGPPRRLSLPDFGWSRR